MDSLQSLLEPFCGYVELGMFTEANEELENVPQDFKTHPVVLHGRVELLIAMKKWDDAVLLGHSLCELWPARHEFWILTAFCLHELKQTQKAKDTLLSAPPDVRETAIYCYNMACYESQLGNLCEAKVLLGACIAKDKKYRGKAVDDPDLHSLWKSLALDWKEVD